MLFLTVNQPHNNNLGILQCVFGTVMTMLPGILRFHIGDWGFQSWPHQRIKNVTLPFKTKQNHGLPNKPNQ